VITADRELHKQSKEDESTELYRNLDVLGTVRHGANTRHRSFSRYKKYRQVTCNAIALLRVVFFLCANWGGRRKAIICWWASPAQWRAVESYTIRSDSAVEEQK
jgi:hypothetical protein